MRDHIDLNESAAGRGGPTTDNIDRLLRWLGLFGAIAIFATAWAIALE